MPVRLLRWMLLFACVPSIAATEDIEFASHGASLSASVVLPGGAPARAAVVFVHGSGKQTRDLGLGQRFADAGIAALVYDKRGAGKSGGEYEGRQSVSEQNISLLADDALAALRALSRHPALQGVPIGFAGISQAGWIAPLAAARSAGSARFLVLWSAPVCKVSEEDIFSIFTRDAPARTASSYAQALDSRREKYTWPEFLGVDTDPATSLAELAIPGLWIFSDNDTSVPVDLSIQRLKILRAVRRDYDYVMFSGLGHDNMDATFATAVDWIRRRARR